MKQLSITLLLLALFLPGITQAQVSPASLPYSHGFEDATENANWTIVNGNSTNKFFIGTASHNGGTQSLYISNDNGVSNAYTLTAGGYVFAYREIAVTTAGSFTFAFDWKAYGEGFTATAGYDFLRAFLIPNGAADTIVPKTGTVNAHTGVTHNTHPASWIALDGDVKLNNVTAWQTFTSDEIPLTAGTYKLAFYWRNDGGGGNQPPVSVDNISVSQVLCSRPLGLSASDITESSATISWTSTAANTFMYVLDTAGAPRQWNDDAIAINTNFISFTDLVPNTPYTFYLQSLCGSDTSIWFPISFRTSCLPISDEQVPYHESFESWVSGSFDPCYVATNNYTSGTANYPSVNTSYHSDSLKSLYMYSTATYATWLALPAFESDITSLQVSFDMYKSTATANYPLLVGVMSNRDDISTFDTVTTVRCDAAAWQSFTIPLSNYTGNGTYIAFVSPNGIASQNYIDNIVVDFLPPCPDPLNVQLSTITETSVNIVWQSTGVSDYMIEYGPTGFVQHSSMGAFEPANGESHTINGLIGNTAYDVYLRSDCSGDTGNWIGPLTFRTACPDVTDIQTVAYVENFDSYNAVSSQYTASTSNELPNCWSFYTNGTLGSTGAYFPRIYRGTAVSPTSNDNNLQMAVMNYTGTTASTLGYVVERGTIKIAKLPAFSEPLSGITISFAAKTTAPSSTNPYNDTLFVAIATTDSTYVPIKHYLSSENLIEVEVDLSSYTALIPSSDDARLAIVWKASSYSSATVRYCGIDNVVVSKSSTCKKPYNAGIIDVDVTSATFAFTDSIDAGSYEIVWDTVNNLEFVVNNAVNLMTTNDTTDVIDNLEPATTYYAWVRSVCGVEYSQWVELGRFVTNCYPLDTLPLAENFDSYTEDVATSASPVSTYPNHAMPPCWKFINMSENTSTYPQAHITSLATYNPNGGNCLFFRSSNTTPIYAVLPKVSENIEDLQLSFSYRNESLTASNGTLAIGVMTNPNNPSTFIELESLPVINEYTRVDYPFFADTMTGNGYYIAFRYTGGSANNYYLAIDNVVVNIGPNCRTSQDLAVANISTNSADLSWVNGTADSYIIAYSTSEGFNPDTCSTVATSTTESVTLTGLIDYTKYYFAVKAVCSTDSGAWSQVETFKTTMECNGLNFVEPIIGNIASTTSNATYPFYSTSNTYPRGITWQLYTQEELEMQGVYSNNLIKAIAYQYTSTTDMDAPLNIYMAEVDTNQIGVPDTLALSSMTLVFSGRHIFTNDDEWSVIELTNPYSYSGSRNLMVAVERDSAVNTAGNFVYTAGPTGVYRCVYSYTNTSGTKSATRTVNRSNIRFSICTEVPACERPDSVVVSNIQPTQVHVSWVGNATTYDVAYGLTGFNIDSTSSYQVVSRITSDSITLTNLIDGGIYDVYVRGNCTSPVATSEWSYKVRFTTPCFPQSVPYIEDFDSYTIDVSQSGAVTPTAYPDHRRPDCWSLLNLSSTTTTYPQAFLSANSSYAQSGNCLFFRSSSSTPIYAVLPKLNANIDTLQILFSYRNEGVTAGNHTITLGVMTNPDDTSTFIPLESYAKTTTITAVEHLFGFDTVSGNNYHIAFRYSGGTSNNMWAAIDSIVIDYMPSCPKPIYLEANNLTETTAELSWTGIAASWIVEYGLAGFELGTGTTLTSNTNSLTLTGLTHSTRYDYYVRGICNVNDTSDWALDPCTFRTECGIISTLPWSADLDGPWYYYPNNDNNARFPSCWSLVNGGSATYNWRNTTTATHIHTGSYAIYYYGTSSSSTEHDDWLITPEIQLTGNEQLTFWMKNPSTSNPSASYVYESRVAIYAYTVNANDTAININNFVQINPYIQIAPGINEYSEYIIPLTGLTGNVHLAFVVDTASYTFYIDDITIEAMPACPKPRFIVADSISQTAVELSWQSTSTDFIVDYKPIYDTVWTSVTGIYSNTTVVAGLNPSTTYQFRVRAVCTAVDTSEWSNVAEFTTLCGAVSLPFFEDFSGTTFPANCWERLSGYPFEGASITSTTSGWNRYTANNYGLPVPHAKVNIYGTTCKYWLVTPEIDLASTPGIELTFDLALTKYNNSIAPDSVGPDDKFMVIISTDGGNTWLQSNATIWGDDSTADYSLRNVSNTGQRVSISLDQYFGDTIRIAFYGESRVSGGDNDLRIDNISVHASCPSPIISSVTPEATTATVTWTSDETSFQVSYKEMTASEWNTEIDVDGVNSYTFTGLLPETAYQFRVRSICDVDEYSMWTVGTFTTLVLPCMAPTNITASEITDRTATIAWDGMENQLSWEVRYVTQGQDTTVVATTNPVVITNLFYGQTYQVWIRAFCGADTYSDWSEVATFNTLSCSPISNLVVAEVNSNNATIVWAAEEGQTQWEVSYGIEGFTEGNGNEIIVSEIPTYQITELESGINYDVYVRAICGEGFYSAWSSRVTFTTTVGINTAQTNNLNATLYPNPATKEATISVEGVSGKVEIIVTDINGRTLLQEETTSEGLLDKTINVEHWTRGTYFVRVVNNDAVAVQKLIVK